jgi:hypothetical protein
MSIQILIAIAAIIGAFYVIVAMRPSELKIVRTAAIPATAEKIFPYINDLNKWEAWSPWAKLDPNAVTTISGSPYGIGAVMSWVGNGKIGEGSMTILESRTNEFIKFRLDFVKPIKATKHAEFTFKQEEDHTIVTWSMYGHNSFINKAIGLILNCEKMVEQHFEKGLWDLKMLVEQK